MRKYEKGEPLISIHLPKTGGTSFQDVIKFWFREKAVFNYFIQGSPPPKYELLSGYCLHGHFHRCRGRGIEVYYSQINQYITIMRNPVDLHVSAYHFKLKQIQKGKMIREWASIGVPKNVDHYLEEYEAQTIYHLPAALTRNNYKQFLEDYFVHVGILEQIDLSIQIIAGKLGKEIIKIPHKNERKEAHSDRLSPISINAFIDRNPLLINLYEYAESINKL